MVDNQCCNCFPWEQLIDNRIYETITCRSIDVYSVVNERRAARIEAIRNIEATYLRLLRFATALPSVSKMA